MGTGRDGWPVLPDGVEPEDYKLIASHDIIGSGPFAGCRLLGPDDLRQAVALQAQATATASPYASIEMTG